MVGVSESGAVLLGVDDGIGVSDDDGGDEGVVFGASETGVLKPEGTGGKVSDGIVLGVFVSVCVGTPEGDGAVEDGAAVLGIVGGVTVVGSAVGISPLILGDVGKIVGVGRWEESENEEDDWKGKEVGMVVVGKTVVGVNVGVNVGE